MRWLQLIRWKNLLIILLTQLLVWWCIIVPFSPVILNLINFCSIALSTMLIAAAGYIINDYFDTKIDERNKPQKVIIGKEIPGRHAIIAHIFLNIIALALAGFVAAGAHHLSWAGIQLAAISLLWFYSTHFKRMFMVGNVVVALLTAFTILMLLVYEPAIKYHIQYPVFENTSSGYLLLNPTWILFIYAFFAFMLTWAREIVKDIEDLEGDTAYGCVTMPVKWGISGSVGFIRLLVTITLAVLAYCSVYLFLTGNMALGLYIMLFLIAPLGVWINNLGNDFTTPHFHNSSSRLKLIMIPGIAFLIVYHCIIWIKSF